MEVYAPLEQLPIWFRNRRPTMTLFARTPLPPERLAASIRQAVAGLDRDVPVFSVEPMEQYVEQATEQSRLNMALLTLLGGLALVLSTLGIYGVPYVVSRRTQEIRIRMALGATRGDVLRLILVHGMTLTLAASRSAWRVVGDYAIDGLDARRRLAARSGHLQGRSRSFSRRSRSRRATCPAAAARDRSDDHAARG